MYIHSNHLYVYLVNYLLSIYIIKFYFSHLVKQQLATVGIKKEKVRKFGKKGGEASSFVCVFVIVKT